MTSITSFCRITEMQCIVDYKVLVHRDAGSEDPWLKQIYKEQEFVYPKFHKMDMLTQAGVLACELIRRARPGIMNYPDDGIALLFANCSSSADTDLRFIRSYDQGGAPSPSLFVYTLPNIVLGEIAILNKWYGEQMFAVLPKFAGSFYTDYAPVVMSTGAAALLCGWIEVVGNKVDVLLFLVEHTADNVLEFSADSIESLKQQDSSLSDLKESSTYLSDGYIKGGS
ncbi:hypothetical protein [Dyadobacter sandarakinus]|uniref:Beta-ketoacyl synthase, N-terminal domain n=1 Tax=Dyadobacter sandarakinus TaxID=2747268 RepID=A0ABX7I4A5_9BACT|nr:hypothetical protein [Dyadobacter sandarakinus]QRR00934.1 hypothetical protein HWI92_08485 [Dyadobacter sandarakinus]